MQLLIRMSINSDGQTHYGYQREKLEWQAEFRCQARPMRSLSRNRHSETCHLISFFASSGLNFQNRLASLFLVGWRPVYKNSSNFKSRWARDQHCHRNHYSTIQLDRGVPVFHRFNQQCDVNDNENDDNNDVGDNSSEIK